MSCTILPAIMSGGAGTRLWPASTDARPKQFLALCGPETLFESTLKRVRGRHGAVEFAPPLVLANVKHAELVEASLAGANMRSSAIALEPEPRNTAAAGAVAAALGAELAPDALILLMPADHIVADAAAFHKAIETATPFARDNIVTFGVKPNRAATEYGYIRAGGALGNGVSAIHSFHEKPDAAKAAAYLATGEYSWNAGLFLFSPKVMLEEFEHSPAIRDGALKALAHAKREGARITLSARHFADIPSAPLDVAVMEKTKRGAVLPCDLGWADVGSWDEVWRLSPHDQDGNAVSGAVTMDAAKNTLVVANGVKVCLAGVEDLIVIATKDAVMVLPRDRAQQVKALREAALKTDVAPR